MSLCESLGELPKQSEGGKAMDFDSAEIIERLRTRLGLPEAARAKQKRWNRSLRFRQRKEGWLRRKHPNCYVYIDNGKLKAAAHSFAELEAELARLGVPIQSAFITFISEQPTVQVLGTTAQAAWKEKVMSDKPGDPGRVGQLLRQLGEDVAWISLHQERLRRKYNGRTIFVRNGKVVATAKVGDLASQEGAYRRMAKKRIPANETVRWDFWLEEGPRWILGFVQVA